MGWVIAGAALAAFVIWTILANRSFRISLQSLAESRAPLSCAEFCARLAESDVSEDVAVRIHQIAEVYYFGWATPYPDDLPLEEPLKVDDEDLAYDIVDLWKSLGLPKKAFPKSIPPGSWKEIAVWFDLQRARLAGFTR